MIYRYWDENLTPAQAAGSDGYPLSVPDQELMTDPQSRRQDGDIVVLWARRDSECDECGRELGRSSFIRVVDRRASCLACADLEHLWFLPRGDAALTRRARKHSRLSAVVVQWSRSRRRYERQGVLVEEVALARAEEECLADADARGPTLTRR